MNQKKRDSNISQLKEGHSMYRNCINHKLFIVILILSVSLFAFSSGANQNAVAQEASTNAYLRQVRTFDPDNTGAINPVGLAYSPGANKFLVLEDGAALQAQTPGSEIVQITPIENRDDSVNIAATISDPINMVFDSKTGRLLLIDQAANELLEIKATASGTLLPDTLVRYDIGRFGLIDPQGLAIDSRSGHLFIAENAGPQLIHIVPERGGGFANARVSAIDLKPTGLKDIRGLAFDPTNDHLHLYSTVDQKLAELTQNGQLLSVRDLSGFVFDTLQGMVFAPSGDLTDDPSKMNLFIADSGADSLPGQAAAAPHNQPAILADYQIFVPLAAFNSNGRTNITHQPGTIIEFSFIDPVTKPAALTAPSIQLGLVQTILASQWSPASPDSAGIVYLPASHSLLVSDSEVNEMPIFTGDNMYVSTLSGALTDTWSTITFSNEPTGVTLNPANGNLFISDDTGDRGVYELNPGPDGLYDTADDTNTFFETVPFGSADPEGVTYASEHRMLFIADGVNSEIYRILPGENGIFDGIGGDDQVTSFDTEYLGLHNPEGVAYNSDSATLYVAGTNSSGGADTLLEVTLEGALVRTIDVSAAHARLLSGLTYAPSSLYPGAMSIFIVDRGQDNDLYPEENDGKIYEMLLPSLSGNGWPIVNAGQDQRITLPNTAGLNAAVYDDGLPASPGTVTNTWSQISGPGVVTFGDPHALNTTASFSQAGIYVLRLTADDGELSPSDEVTVTVVDNGITVEARVAADPDDAEETYTGAIELTSPDLDLGRKPVGVRFTGLEIPHEAVILNAYIQFTADKVGTPYTSLSVVGEAIGDAPTFTADVGNISSRAMTAASVNWLVSEWPLAGEAGIAQRSPNLAPIIQEIVDGPGWIEGNAMALIINYEEGWREAVAYDRNPGAAPLLHVEYLEATTALAGHEQIHIRQNASISGNAVSLSKNVELNAAAFLGGSINSGADAWLEDGVTVVGDVTAVNQVILEGSAAVQGTVIANTGITPVEPILAVPFAVMAGTQNITVGPNQSLNLPPGIYRDLIVESDATLTLNSGLYVFKTIEAKDDALLHLDQSVGPIRVDVAEKVKLGQRVNMTSTGSAENILFRVIGGVKGKDIELCANGSFIGTFLGSSAADVELEEDANLTGALFGKKIDIRDRAQLIGAPALDLIYGTAAGAPVITITSPLDVSASVEGILVSFSGTAVSFGGENLTANISWESSLDGHIGDGGSFSKSDLSLGTHTITATVVDNAGNSASDEVTITINPPSLSPTALGSHDKVKISKDANISGNATSINDNVELDDNIFFDGSVSSGHDVKLNRGATVTGDVTAANKVSLKQNASIQGTISANTGVAPDEPVLSVSFDVTPGTADVTLEENQTLILTAGSYGQLTVKKNAHLTLESGQYAFLKVVVEDNATVHLDQSGGAIQIDVADTLVMGKGMQMTSTAGAENILFRVMGHIELLENGSFMGTFLGSASSDVKLERDATLIGALFGKTIEVKDRVQMTGAPALDLIFGTAP